jgi:RNA polymerase sigma-70 factor (ECF subfamily)
MPEAPDGDLLRRFVQGDRDAFEALFRQHQVEVYRWAVRIVRDPGGAEDVVIEAFFRAFRSHARFDADRPFAPWIRRIATNVARDHLRAVRRQREVEAVDRDLVASPAPDGDLTKAVARALRRLSPRLQVVATLALVEQRPYAEIADALDVPVGTVKSRVSRATRALRRELARLGITP